MKANEYQKLARKTAIMDNAIAPRRYHWFLGMVEEYFELLFSPVIEMSDELGDILWYLANFAAEFDIKMSDLAPGEYGLFDMETDILDLNSSPHRGREHHLNLLGRSIGEIAQYMKRSDWDTYKPVLHHSLVQILTDMLLHIVWISLGVVRTVSEIMQTNIEKLSNNHPRSRHIGKTD